MTPAAPAAPGEWWIRRIGLVAGPLAAGAVALATSGLPGPARLVAATSTLMAAWWMTDALPMWLPALLPFLVFPLAGIVPAAAVTRMPIDPLILLFVGGMLLARALEASGLHRRLALWVIAAVGTTPRRLVLGVMLAATTISLGVSNSATVLMLYPIALALVERAAPDPADRRETGGAVMLALAYGANIGGAACMIGSPANLVMIAPLQGILPEGSTVDFVHWLGMGIPFAILLVPLAWLWLTRVAFRLAPAGAPADVATELAALGPPRRAEWAVGTSFALATVAWSTQLFWPAWARLPGLWPDATIALVAAGLAACVPAGRPDRRLVLHPRDLLGLPWGLLTVIAGGLVLSTAFQSSGLTKVVGAALVGASGWPPLALVAATATAVIGLSAVTSNTGTGGIVGPILVAAAPALGVDPRLLVLPAALAVSCDFALPVGTPPNAIVFGSGYLTLGRMARTGIVVDLLAAAVVTVVTFLVVVPVFGIVLGGPVPAWARGGG